MASAAGRANRQALATAVTMMLIALWHAVSWATVVFGVYHAVSLIGEPKPPLGLRQLLDHFGAHGIRPAPGLAHGRVNTQGPFAVIATQCSK